MLAKVFDHCSMKYKKGFRLLTLGWSDGNSFVPINHCLLSAAKDENLLCAGKQYDGRSLAARRRKQSRRKATDVMLELLQDAIKSGHQAKYVLLTAGFLHQKQLLLSRSSGKFESIISMILDKLGWDNFFNKSVSINKLCFTTSKL